MGITGGAKALPKQTAVGCGVPSSVQPPWMSDASRIDVIDAPVLAHRAVETTANQATGTAFVRQFKALVEEQVPRGDVLYIVADDYTQTNPMKDPTLRTRMSKSNHKLEFKFLSEPNPSVGDAIDETSSTVVSHARVWKEGLFASAKCKLSLYELLQAALMEVDPFDNRWVCVAMRVGEPNSFQRTIRHAVVERALAEVCPPGVRAVRHSSFRGEESHRTFVPCPPVEDSEWIRDDTEVSVDLSFAMGDLRMTGEGKEEEDMWSRYQGSTLRLTFDQENDLVTCRIVATDGEEELCRRTGISFWNDPSETRLYVGCLPLRDEERDATAAPALGIHVAIDSIGAPNRKHQTMRASNRETLDIDNEDDAVTLTSIRDANGDPEWTFGYADLTQPGSFRVSLRLFARHAVAAIPDRCIEADFCAPSAAFQLANNELCPAITSGRTNVVCHTVDTDWVLGSVFAQKMIWDCANMAGRTDRDDPRNPRIAVVMYPANKWCPPTWVFHAASFCKKHPNPGALGAWYMGAHDYSKGVPDVGADKIRDLVDQMLLLQGREAERTQLITTLRDSKGREHPWKVFANDRCVANAMRMLKVIRYGEDGTFGDNLNPRGNKAQFRNLLATSPGAEAYADEVTLEELESEDENETESRVPKRFNGWIADAFVGPHILSAISDPLKRLARRSPSLTPPPFRFSPTVNDADAPWWRNNPGRRFEHALCVSVVLERPNTISIACTRAGGTALKHTYVGGWTRRLDNSENVAFLADALAHVRALSIGENGNRMLLVPISSDIETIETEFARAAVDLKLRHYLCCDWKPFDHYTSLRDEANVIEFEDWSRASAIAPEADPDDEASVRKRCVWRAQAQAHSAGNMVHQLLQQHKSKKRETPE